jgi:hypothetical protein
MSAAQDTVHVHTVRDRRSLRSFIDLPYRLHAGTPWVPPLRLERWLFLDRRVNAFFRHGRAEYFVARRGGRSGPIVGRITAQVDDAYNAFHGNRWGMFGFLEFEEDPEVLRALLDAARTWLRAAGCDHVIGPMDFTMNDESGVLIEGFELDPLVKQPWHPPYYQRLLEDAGLTKAMDLLSWDLDISDRDQMMSLLVSAGERAKTEHGITIRPMARRHLRRELDAFADVYNSAWSRNWGFVPYGKADLDAYALELQLVYSPGWFMVAEHAGETVAMAITVMDINQVLKKMNGRLLPLGWWYFLRRHHIVDRLRVGFLGVKPEYQHTGAGPALFLAHFDAAEHSPLKHGEAGWILETNRGMNRGLKLMNGRIVKRYRVYEQDL